MNKKIRIGTRGSQLALWQANWVKGKLSEWNPGMEIEIHKIKTTGDKILDVPLAKVGGKGLFVKEIEEALFDKKIDIAVHSMKDVPTDLPEGLCISAITEREDPRDALISKDGLKLKELKKGAKIGTSSLRRQVQLLNFREDFKIYLPYDIFLPAIGQGALGIEIRDSDREAGKIVERFNHRETSLCVRAERSFLERLEGGCQVPIAAFGMINGNTKNLEGSVGSIDGKILYRDTETDGENRVEELGVRLAEKLLNMGADKILKEVYGNSVFL